ncbi:extracellular solute-binding protein [candidate division KSB1 bacterium]|nr:extracellular solute-binding protein [candidate division KSB1 bacterium]
MESKKGLILFFVIVVAVGLLKLLGPRIRKDDRVRLVAWGITEGEARVGYQAMLDGYMERNPNIRIVATPIGRGTSSEKLMAAVAGNSPPDLILQDRNLIGNWAGRGAFMTLDSLLANDPDTSIFKIREENFYPACWHECKYQGKMYAIPSLTNVSAFYWNKKLFREAGYDPDRPPRDWDELNAMGMKLNKFNSDGSIRVLGFLPNLNPAGDPLVLYCWQNRGEIISEDGRTCLLNSPQNAEALKYVVRFYDRLGGPRTVEAFRSSVSTEEALGPFFRDRIAMMIDDDWSLYRIARHKPDMDFGIAPLPAPRNGIPYTWSGGLSYAIPEGATHVKEAWDLIKWMVSKEANLIKNKAWGDYTRSKGKQNYVGLHANIEANKAVIDSLGFKAFIDSVRFRAFIDTLGFKAFIDSIGFEAAIESFGLKTSVDSLAFKAIIDSARIRAIIETLGFNAFIDSFDLKESVDSLAFMKIIDSIGFKAAVDSFGIIAVIDSLGFEEVLDSLGFKNKKFANAQRVLSDLMSACKPYTQSVIMSLLQDEDKRCLEKAFHGTYTPEQSLAQSSAIIQSELDRVWAQTEPNPVNWRKIFLIISAIFIAGLIVYFIFLIRDIRRKQDTEPFWGVFFVSPWFIGFTIFILGPFLFSIILSFCEYDVLHPAQFVGFKNFSYLFKDDPLFWKSLYNTIFMVLGVPLNIVVSLGIALLLNANVKRIAFYRTVYYLPSIVPIVAGSVLWLWVLNPDYGIINAAWKATLTRFFEIPSPLWFRSEAWSKPSILLMGLWGAGGSMLIWLAGLKDIPQTLYEAAKIDGAGRWKQFVNITIPMLSPYIFFNMIMGIIGTFKIFAQSYVMTEGGPLDSTLFYVYYIFNNAFRYFRMGYASALAWILFIIIVLITLFQFVIAPRWVHYQRN